MNNPGLDILKLHLHHAIGEGVTLTNKKYGSSPQADYETILREALNEKLDALNASLPALLFNTGLADSFNENYKYSFIISLNEIKNVSYTPLNLPPHFNVLNKNIYDIDCSVCIETVKSKPAAASGIIQKPAPVPLSMSSRLKKDSYPASGKNKPDFYEKKDISEFFTGAKTELKKERLSDFNRQPGNLSGNTAATTSKGTLMIKCSGYGGAVAGTMVSERGSEMMIADIGFIPYPHCG